MSNEIILTGIKPTGEPHFGNYLGAIQPALQLAKQHSSEKKLFFIADYHALTTIKDAKQLETYRHIVAATWLSFFKDVPNCHFYFQSQIPEIFELYWILSCVCPKGLLNRAHAYKTIVANNMDRNRDPDYQINHGVFAYPVLMAADILLFHATKVPVGLDQKQHVEIAVEIVNSLNRYLDEKIPVPSPIIDSTVDVIIGIDGQKMSKNYDNTIPLFSEESVIKKKIMKIKTDSVPMGEPLNPLTCNVFKLLSYIVPKDKLTTINHDYRSGTMGYGQAKTRLFDEYFKLFSKERQQFDEYMSNLDGLMEQLDPEPIRVTASKNLMSIKNALGF